MKLKSQGCWTLIPSRWWYPGVWLQVGRHQICFMWDQEPEPDSLLKARNLGRSLPTFKKKLRQNINNILPRAMDSQEACVTQLCVKLYVCLLCVRFMMSSILLIKQLLQEFILRLFSDLVPGAIVESNVKLLERKGCTQKEGKVNKHSKIKASHSVSSHITYHSDKL